MQAMNVDIIPPGTDSLCIRQHILRALLCRLGNNCRIRSKETPGFSTCERNKYIFQLGNICVWKILN